MIEWCQSTYSMLLKNADSAVSLGIAGKFVLDLMKGRVIRVDNYNNSLGFRVPMESCYLAGQRPLNLAPSASSLSKLLDQLDTAAEYCLEEDVKCSSIGIRLT